jgi:sucrose-6-phosphate hydrolase SacC (GH32 family)
MKTVSRCLLVPCLSLLACAVGAAAENKSVADPTRPIYHLISPAAGEHIADPNFAHYWKGKYHLFYIAAGGFAHVSSVDMVHWRSHPNTSFSGLSGTMFVNRDGVPTIIAKPGEKIVLMSALDDDLEKWSPPVPVEPKVRPDQDGKIISHWDPDIWEDNGVTYALFGYFPLDTTKEATVMKSTDQKNWEYVGKFLSKEMPGVTRSKDVRLNDDISCPNFFKIGNKWMLLCISHRRGCRYYLGDWKGGQFTPDFHGWMNWSQEDGANLYGHGGAFFAPESLLTPDGRRVMWAWMFACSKKRFGPTWHEVISLPRELSLPEDGILRIKPLRELEQLRRDPAVEKDVVVQNETPYRLKDIAGDAIEVSATIEQGEARAYGVRVLCDKSNGQGLDVVVVPTHRTLRVGDTTAPLDLLPDENIQLRIFVDRSVVEVFVNDRQAVVKQHGYAPGDVGVCLFSKGGKMKVREVTGWQMAAANP